MDRPVPSYEEIIELIKAGIPAAYKEKLKELSDAALKYRNENVTLKNTIKELRDALERRGRT